MKLSTVHSAIAGRDVRPLLFTPEDIAAIGMDTLDDLQRIGINFGAHEVAQMAAAFDAAPDLAPLMYASQGGVPVQFLQTILPGFVGQQTAARKIDTLIGVQTVGSWEDEEIVQGAMEYTGLATPYTDYGNIPLASYNLSYERRSVVRFEEGMRVGKLEAARAAKGKVNSAARKRMAAATALDLQRNQIGFYGYNAGTNRTYGFLNDPSLPAYGTVANPGAGTGWPVKTALEVIADLQTAIELLRTQSGDQFDPSTSKFTIALPTSRIGTLGTVTQFGYSIRKWLTDTYPGARVESAPQLDLANGGANVFYVYADRADDGDSDDDGATWAQFVPARFMTIGVEQQAKAYVEDFGNALAGVMLKRPYLVVRRTGI